MKFIDVCYIKMIILSNFLNCTDFLFSILFLRDQYGKSNWKSTSKIKSSRRIILNRNQTVIQWVPSQTVGNKLVNIIAKEFEFEEILSIVKNEFKLKFKVQIIILFYYFKY